MLLRFSVGAWLLLRTASLFTEPLLLRVDCELDGVVVISVVFCEGLVSAVLLRLFLTETVVSCVRFSLTELFALFPLPDSRVLERTLVLLFGTVLAFALLLADSELFFTLLLTLELVSAGLVETAELFTAPFLTLPVWLPEAVLPVLLFAEWTEALRTEAW